MLYRYKEIEEGVNTASMRSFSQIIEELEFNDIPQQGAIYTWRGGVNNTKPPGLMDSNLQCLE